MNPTSALTRAETLKCLTMAEKLLAGRDLNGSRSLAALARDSDPTLLYADQIMAVADTLLAGDTLIGDYLPDMYAVLQVSPPEAQDGALLLKRFRKLAMLLDPQKNELPFSEPAFRLLHDAWRFLSNPSKKAFYDRLLMQHPHHDGALSGSVQFDSF